MKFAAIFPALTLVAGMLPAQKPDAKPGSVEGIVINSVTGEPIKKAIVSLGGKYTATTDAAGHFHFDNVASGAYAIGAEKDGFQAPNLGRGQSATVAEGQHVQDVALKLVPFGSASGHVLDEDGEPIARAQISVVRYFYSPRGRQLIPVAAVRSNDLGEFEASTPPGRYYFQVTAEPPRRIPPRTHWTRPEEAYPVVFYPNASEAAQATVVNVAAGARLNNIDFRLHKMPAHHIRGKVNDKAAGSPRNDARVDVTRPGAFLGMSLADSAIQSDGSFDPRGLVSDSYTVTYAQFGSGRIFNTTQKVRVTDADVDGVDLTPKPAVTVSGTVTAEGSQPKILNIRVALSPVDGTEQGGEGVTSANGNFAIAEVPPETFDLQITDVPRGKYVKSIRFGGRDANNGLIDLTAGSSLPVNIVLGEDGAEVDGSVQNASGQPVAATEVTLAPAEEYDRRWDLAKRAVTDPSGNFRIKDVAPGEYKVFAWESDPEGSAQSAEFRKAFESRSAAVSVGPKDKASVQVIVITSDDVAKEISKLP